MSEGLLYKKIRELYSPYKAEDVLIPEEFEKATEKVLSEAKQDFPKSWNDWIRDQPEFKRGDKHIDLHDMWQRYAFEMIDWKKKWFGDAEKEGER